VHRGSSKALLAVISLSSTGRHSSVCEHQRLGRLPQSLCKNIWHYSSRVFLDALLHRHGTESKVIRSPLHKTPRERCKPQRHSVVVIVVTVWPLVLFPAMSVSRLRHLLTESGHLLFQRHHAIRQVVRPFADVAEHVHLALTVISVSLKHVIYTPSQFSLILTYIKYVIKIVTRQY